MVAKSENGAKAKGMSKAERQVLIRLVRQRFKLLDTAVNARRHQLEAALREEIVAEHERQIEEYRARYEAEVLTAHRAVEAALEAWQRDATDAGLIYGNTSWLRDSMRYGHKVTLEPADLHEEVQRRLQERLGGKPLTRYALELEESRLIEELLVGDLDSDGAQAFLSRVPDAEALVPLANSGAVAALEAGA